MIKHMQKNKELASFLGIGPNRSLFNRRNLIVTFVLSAAVISNCVYCCEAKTFQQYVGSIYGLTAQMELIINFAIYVLNNHQIFRCFDQVDEIVDDRE